jgi:hypothetical protein
MVPAEEEEDDDEVALEVEGASTASRVPGATEGATGAPGPASEG